jgi:predicted SAM-dependent methyltransferase
VKLLNLGCGSKFHRDWVNVDSVKTGDEVITCNLSKGIPFPDSSFDVVYHSHLLEHFSKQDAIEFIKECHRVLTENGIIRIAVPNLEIIAKEYLLNLERAIRNEPNASNDYEWIMLELFDQTTRNYSGGEMAKYLQRIDVPNIEYVYHRIGDEGRKIHENYLKSANRYTDKQEEAITIKLKKQIKKIIKLISYKKEVPTTIKIGNFRMSGEIHQWMYDRYSLSKLLSETGFHTMKIVTAFESQIPDWNKYELDSSNGKVRKPDSIFIEATK